MLTITEKYGNVPFLLCGDFNARTGNKQPYHVLDMEYFTTVAQDEQYGAQGQRRSQDSEENDFGKLFLELCTQFDLCLLNGACEGDERGLYTFVSSTGNSVIDYFALSRSLAHLPQKMCIEERIDSQHMPISCVLKCVDDVLNPDFKPFSFERLIWMPENLSIFTEKLKERNTIKDLDAAK